MEDDQGRWYVPATGMDNAVLMVDGTCLLRGMDNAVLVVDGTCLLRGMDNAVLGRWSKPA